MSITAPAVKMVAQITAINFVNNKIQNREIRRTGLISPIRFYGTLINAGVKKAFKMETAIPHLVDRICSLLVFQKIVANLLLN